MFFSVKFFCGFKLLMIFEKVFIFLVSIFLLSDKFRNKEKLKELMFIFIVFFL